MKKNAIPVLVLAALGLLAVAGPASAADAGLQARVAGGGKVPLLRSAQTAAQWSAQRPKFRDLRPKARSNLE